VAVVWLTGSSSMIDVRVSSLRGQNNIQLDPSWPVSEVKRRLHEELHELGIPSPETQKIVSFFWLEMLGSVLIHKRRSLFPSNDNCRCSTFMNLRIIT
jgi:hypothetical protein